MSAITSILHPALIALGDLIAFFYGLVHDYSFAVALLTVLVYLLLTPLLVKQTRSMIQMQKIQPEMRRLQQKYKGRDLESRQKLQEEMMALYKHHGVNPASGCLSAIPQLVVLGIMYAVIRGLLNVKTYKIRSGAVRDLIVNGHKVADPKYISHSSTLYHNLVASHGTMPSLGINLAISPGQHHSSFAAALPYYLLLAGAVVLSFLQIQQMTIRNRKIMEQTPQMRQMQRMQLVFPAIMILIYWKFPAILSVYFVVSSLFRIVQQELMYRFDPVLVAHVDEALTKKGEHHRLPLAFRRKAAPTRTSAPQDVSLPVPSSTSSTSSPDSNGSSRADGSSRKGGSRQTSVKEDGTAKPATMNSSSSPRSASSHPRSRAKRPRKAR